MNDITSLPVMTARDAQAIGFAVFNAGATVPDARGAPIPVFDIFTIGHGDTRAYDSRSEELTSKPSIAVILLSGPADDDH